ncbi:MAG TPA: sigma 54-interacting transcriptional regulator [Bacillota bacterium]|nr:sigma 54-interacting transcriptional regulator [Bacillota bacterium]
MDNGNIQSLIDGMMNKFHMESMSEDAVNILNELLHIFYNSEDGIYVVDGKGITIRANPSFGKFAGVEIEGLIGRDVRELVREGVFSRSAAIEALEEKKVKTIVQEYSNGKIGLVTSTPIKNSKGEVIKIISNIRDITELSKLYDTLSAKERLIQKYSKMIDEINLMEANGIVAESEGMLNTIKAARKVARTDGGVIILGESGVGKSMIAKLIANLSDRSGKTFVSVNCGAIPEGLMESELFGYVEGAFTGASKGGKVGLIEEIAEIPLFLQPKLLMFLENKEVVRVGAVKPKKVNVRIITATNKNLYEMVKQGTFRDDLYYRLNVIPITIPPLRDRKEDIIPLINNLMEDLNERNGEKKTVSKEVINIFMEYSWPGNIRQLKNVLERMYILSSGEMLEYADIPKELLGNGNGVHPSGGTNIRAVTLPLSLPDEIAEMEKEMIRKALKQAGSIRKAAKLLGLSSSSLFRRMTKFDCFEKETINVSKTEQNFD